MARERSDENTNLTHPQAAGMAPDVTHVRPVGGPVGLAWREGTLTRACELEALCAWIRLKNPRNSDRALTTSIHYHLEAARDAALGKKPDPKWLRIFRNGPLIERAMSNLDAAEAQLLNLAPPDYVHGQMPSLLRHVQRHLGPTDPGRQEFERIARRVGISDPDPLSQDKADQDFDERKATRTIETQRGKIVATVRAASSHGLREQVRLRSFRNTVVVTTALMTVLAIGVAVTGLLFPMLVPLCFAPELGGGKSVVVCPTGQSGPFIPLQTATDQQVQAAGENPRATPVIDIDKVVEGTANKMDLIIVELVGITAAAIAAAAAIRNIRGSSERCGLPVALAVLKLPTGAITAFLGLLLMRGQFIPGLSALDSPAQILAWALVFGFAQQLFTRLVDQQGQFVLNTVRAADNPQPTDKPA